MNTPKEALIISAAGAAILAWMGWPIFHSFRAKRWPLLPATITHSEVVSRPGSKHRYGVEIGYTYIAGTQQHHGIRLSFSDPTFYRKDQAQNFLKPYRHGAKIKIHCNPANPEQAVARTAVPWSNYFGAALGAIFLAGGLVTLLRLLVR